MLIETGLELFVAQGIQHTTVEQIYTRVGISRTFFYTFFPAKEDLVIEAFYRQQRQILAYAESLRDDPTLDWREGVECFFRNLCSGGQRRFAIMSVEEQQTLSRCLSGETRQAFQKRQLTFIAKLLEIFGVRAGAQTVKLIGNLVFSTAIVSKAVPDTLPFLFPDAADEMTAFQIDAILDFMETLRKE